MKISLRGKWILACCMDRGGGPAHGFWAAPGTIFRASASDDPQAVRQRRRRSMHTQVSTPRSEFSCEFAASFYIKGTNPSRMSDHSQLRKIELSNLSSHMRFTTRLRSA